MAQFAELAESVEAGLRELKTKLPLISSDNRDTSKVGNDEASRLIRDLDRYIKSMEAETRASAPSQRRGLSETIERLKAELASLKIAIQRANDTASRTSLLGSKDTGKKMEADGRDKMIATTEKAVRGTGKLEAAHATLVETEDIGINVIDSMQQQRELLIKSKTNASDTNALTVTARSTVYGMQRVAFGNKLLLMSAIVILLICIGVIVYFAYIKNPK